MALAFSGQAGAAIKHGGKSLGGTRAAGGVGGDASKGQGGFEDSWMATAAAIISNKVSPSAAMRCCGVRVTPGGSWHMVGIHGSAVIFVLSRCALVCCSANGILESATLSAVSPPLSLIHCFYDVTVSDKYRSRTASGAKGSCWFLLLLFPPVRIVPGPSLS